MNRLTDYFMQLLRNIENMDKAKLVRELREIAYHTNRQLFSQIPGVSAIVGILVGSWVATTFTNSPIRGFLSSWGLMRGGTHVVSTTTYRFISLFLPIISTALTAYIVQKALRTYRESRLERNISLVSLLGQDVQAELNEKMGILDKAKEVGLISESEHKTKIANLYQSYIRNFRSKVEELLIKKLES